MQIYISSDLMYGYNNIWSLGGMGDYTTKNNGLVTNFYSNERSGIVYPNNPIEWDSNNYLGLMYPSDYGYAVGGNVRTTCLETEMYNWNNETCGSNDWLKPQSGNYWTIMSNDNNPNGVFYISSNGYIRGDADVTNSYGVAPVAYLYEGCISEGDGTIDNPFTYMPVLCGY